MGFTSGPGCAAGAVVVGAVCAAGGAVSTWDRYKDTVERILKSRTHLGGFRSLSVSLRVLREGSGTRENARDELGFCGFGADLLSGLGEKVLQLCDLQILSIVAFQ
jgi:hypothetical protein